VLPPYTSDEVAAAVVAALTAAGVRGAALTVTASDIAMEWCVAAARADGRQLVASYPFATPEGITVPSEIAAWFVELVHDED
jgi:hypothetical protein